MVKGEHGEGRKWWRWRDEVGVVGNVQGNGRMEKCNKNYVQR